MIRYPIITLLVLLLVLLHALPAHAAILETSADEDYCAVINAAGPGDEVRLAAGRYTSPCSIRASGEMGRPLVIRSGSEVDGERAVFAYPGRSSNVIDLRMVSYVQLIGLEFDHSENDIDGIKIHASSDVLIARCRFRDMGGVSISAPDGSTARLTIRQNRLVDLRATGMYFGCHDGSSCQSTDLLVENNFIQGVTPRGSSVGYGMQLKLNSYGVVRDNTVYDTAGPGIMVYGSDRGDPPTIVEGNYVEGSRNDGAIVIGGGPAWVRNNIALGGAVGGIVAQNYGGRGLQQDVWIVHNTILDNARRGLRVEAWQAGAGNVLANNAIWPREGTQALDPADPAGFVRGNITCDASCFERGDPAPRDLRPSEGSPLLGAGGSDAAPWRPMDDFVSVRRGADPAVGALEREDRPLMLGAGEPRPERLVEPPAMDGGVPMADGGTPIPEAGAGSDAAPPSGSDAAPNPEPTIMEGGCGCTVASRASTPSRPLALLMLSPLAFVVLGRARRRSR